MSDSEEDYMSDKLLAGCSDDKDVRPGLVFKKSDKRKLNIYKKHLEQRAVKKPKSYKEQEQETRDKGLKTAISSENKGFKLMEKLGYKPGTSLGKDSTGIKEPIPIEVKEDSAGLGKRKRVVKKLVHTEDESKEDNFKLLEDNFRTCFSEQYYNRFLQLDLQKARQICEELDRRQNITFPQEIFFWPTKIEPPVEESSSSSSLGSENESDEDEKEEKRLSKKEKPEIIPDDEMNDGHLQDIINYLRSKHLYCIYCAITFNDEKDMAYTCPGAYREEHED